jgi:leucyl/phenylalanyl-tRNA--protein transferase
MPRRQPPLLFAPHQADAEGLVAVGGDLKPETLLRAYRSGVFPWYDDSTPILWWSPDPRAIFELDAFHPPRRLLRTIRGGKFTCTIDQGFAQVMRGCADRPGEGTWLTAEMIDAYEELHRLGHAHSVEVWRGETLAGGIYGLAIGGFFAGESMFHRVTDASKVALVHLIDRLKARGYTLFDIQMATPHTTRLGAVEIPRAEYLKRLKQAVKQVVTFL